MFRRTTAALMTVFALSAFSTTGCIGQMATSGKVMKFNLRVVESKWARWLVFLLLYIIPVYEIAALIDLLIINSIEFHTGTNPLTDKPRIAVREGASEVVLADGSRGTSTLQDDGSVVLDLTDAKGDNYVIRLVPVPGGVEARDENGTVIGRVDGDGTLHSTQGVIGVAPKS
jgi:hypothetical protein